MQAIIHEFAYKLDMQDGRVNGFPPLHKGMSTQKCAEEFNNAFIDFEIRI